MKKLAFLIALFAVAPTMSCSNTIAANDEIPFNTNTAKDEILNQGKTWNNAFENKNPEIFRQIFADDFQFASAGGKCKSAEKCITGFTDLIKKRPDLKWSVADQDLEIMNNWGTAIETGTWLESWTEEDGFVTIKGKYTFLWKREKHLSGPWFLHSAIFAPLTCEGKSKYCNA